MLSKGEMRIVILGAGISGLSLAWYLKKKLNPM